MRAVVFALFLVACGNPPVAPSLTDGGADAGELDAGPFARPYCTLVTRHDAGADCVPDEPDPLVICTDDGTYTNCDAPIRSDGCGGVYSCSCYQCADDQECRSVQRTNDTVTCCRPIGAQKCSAP